LRVIIPELFFDKIDEISVRNRASEASRRVKSDAKEIDKEGIGSG